MARSLADKLKLRAEGDFKGRHFEGWLIIQAVSWRLRPPLSYRDLESLYAERGFDVDHATITRRALAHAPMIGKVCGAFVSRIAAPSASTRPM